MDGSAGKSTGVVESVALFLHVERTALPYTKGER